MKSLIFIFLSLLPAAVEAQTIPKKCNEIQVRGVNFRTVVVSLLDAGYSIEKIDSNLMTVRTEPKSYSKKTGGMVALDIRVKDSIVIVKGHCGLRPSDFKDKEDNFMKGKYYYEIEAGGMKGSLGRESFEVMNSFALSLHGSVEYFRK